MTKIGNAAPAGVEQGRAHLLALQIRRRPDARLLEGEHRRGRRVVDHHDRHRLVGGGRVVADELDQRGQVREAHLVGARRDPVDRVARAAARVDLDVELLLREIALRLGQQERRGVPLEAPVELELDLLLRDGRAGSQSRDRRQRHRHRAAGPCPPACCSRIPHVTLSPVPPQRGARPQGRAPDRGGVMPPGRFREVEEASLAKHMPCGRPDRSLHGAPRAGGARTGAPAPSWHR